MTNNDLQNTAQKTKGRATWTPLKTWGEHILLFKKTKGSEARWNTYFAPNFWSSWWRLYCSWIYTYWFQSVPITTKVVSSVPVLWEVHAIPYVIKNVTDLQQVGGCLMVVRKKKKKKEKVLPPITLIVTKLDIYVFITITELMPLLDTLALDSSWTMG